MLSEFTWTAGYEPPEMLESDMEENVRDSDAAERGVHPPPVPGEQDHRGHHRRTASIELGDPGGAPSNASRRGRAIAFCRRYCGAICSVVSYVWFVIQP